MDANKGKNRLLSSFVYMFTLLDFLCSFSIVGIYPRYIEPNIIQVTKHQVITKHASLDGLKILQISDIHFNKTMFKGFLERLSRKIQRLQPDLIALTGDFIQFSQLDDLSPLKKFLTSLKAPLGCYAVLGNHDYSEYIGILPERSYGVKGTVPAHIQLKDRLAKQVKKPNGSFSLSLRGLVPHPILSKLLEESNITLLHNEKKVLLPELTLYGTGEYWAADCDERIVEESDSFSLLLIHNPDGFKLFCGKKVDLALSGHIHSGQINIPGIRDLFLLSEEGYVKGFYGPLYVNRGVGGTLPLRLCAVPEISTFELKYA